MGQKPKKSPTAQVDPRELRGAGSTHNLGEGGKEKAEHIRQEIQRDPFRPDKNLATEPSPETAEDVDPDDPRPAPERGSSGAIEENEPRPGRTVGPADNDEKQRERI